MYDMFKILNNALLWKGILFLSVGMSVMFLFISSIKTVQAQQLGIGVKTELNGKGTFLQLRWRGLFYARYKYCIKSYRIRNCIR